MSLARSAIVTERLLLQASQPSMAAAVCDYVVRNRAHFARWDPPTGEAFYTEPFQAGRLELAAQAFGEGTGYRWWLCLQEAPGRVVGSVHFSQVARGAFHSAMLGYALDAGCEGRGLMTEALEAAIAEVFSERVNLHRIQANHRPENLRSAATLRRLGFREEGLARDYLFIDGAWRDHVLTALLNPAFQPLVGW